MANDKNDNQPRDPTAEKEYIFPDRVVVKKTGCQNCVGYNTGPEIEKYWRSHPDIKAQIMATIHRIQQTGIVLPERSAVDALAVAQKARSGISDQQAILELQAARLADAQRQQLKMGRKPVWADRRLIKFEEVAVGIRLGAIGVCRGHGVKMDGTEFGPADLVQPPYHCCKWTGRTGWSLAHDPDRKLDPLPAELTERVNAGEKIKS
jgi:hypothetical protein